MRNPAGIKKVMTGGRHIVDRVTSAERPSGVRAESMRTLVRSGGVDAFTKEFTAEATCADVR